LAFIDVILTHNNIYISLAAFVLGIVVYQFDIYYSLTLPVSAKNSTNKKLFFSVPINRYELIKFKISFRFFIIARSILFQNGRVESMSGDFFSTRKSWEALLISDTRHQRGKNKRWRRTPWVVIIGLVSKFQTMEVRDR